MQKVSIPRQLKDALRRERNADIVFTLFLLAVLIGISIALLSDETSAKDKGILLVGLATLTASWLSLYLTIVRPLFRKPILELSTAPIQPSPPTPQEEQAGAQRSWFARLQIVNYGQTPARNCIGRLIEIRDEDCKQLDKFDPSNLYWARQDRPENFSPVNILGYGDFVFLDVAQIIEAHNACELRIVIPERHRLVITPGQPEGSRLLPGTYYLLIGINADNAYIEPTWFKFVWQEDYSDEPCNIEKIATAPPCLS